MLGQHGGDSLEEGGNMEMIRWSPFRELDAMERRMRRLFPEGFATAPTPAADVFETESEVVVELEVPGFSEQELDVELLDHTLRVKGERREEAERKERAFLAHERLATMFERRFELPVDTDPEKVVASFEQGVLEIHVPKAAPTTPKKVEIAAKS
jgi:HSP20 family protein